MEERIDEIIKMYNACFEDLDSWHDCKETAVLEFNINPELIKESLIEIDIKIYRQKQSVRDLVLRKIYPNYKEVLRQLYKRLNNVHEVIYDILMDEFDVSAGWLYPEKDEIENLTK